MNGNGNGTGFDGRRASHIWAIRVCVASCPSDSPTAYKITVFLWNFFSWFPNFWWSEVSYLRCPIYLWYKSCVLSGTGNVFFAKFLVWNRVGNWSRVSEARRHTTVVTFGKYPQGFSGSACGSAGFPQFRKNNSACFFIQTRAYHYFQEWVLPAFWSTSALASSETVFSGELQIWPAARLELEVQWRCVDQIVLVSREP